MSNNKGRKATVDIYINRSDANGLLYVLDCYEKTGGTNKYVRLASNLKENILNYGRISTAIMEGSIDVFYAPDHSRAFLLLVSGLSISL